jgi:hypothetical protein
LRWEAIAARFSSASTASLRRSGFRERSAGARICSSLAVRRRAEDAQVPAADAEALQLGHGAHDLALRVVVPQLAVVAVPLDHAVVLELLHERPVRAGVFEHLLEPELGAGTAEREGRAPEGARFRRRGLRHVVVCPSRGQLLTDHP